MSVDAISSKKCLIKDTENKITSYCKFKCLTINCRRAIFVRNCRFCANSSLASTIIYKKKITFIKTKEFIHHCVC